MKKLLFLLLFSWQIINAQDAQFTQFDRSVLYLNPAFAGTAEEFRVGLAHRQQWLGLDANFQSTYLAFDYNAAHIRSGFGLIGIFDKVGESWQLQSGISGIYTFFVPIRNWQLRLGVQAGLGNRFLDTQQLIFTSQVLDNEPDVFEGGNGATRTYFDAGTGFLFYNEKFWIGGAFHHLNRPQYSLYPNVNSELSTKISFQMGANFEIKSPTGSVFLMPSLLFRQQGAAQQFESSLRMGFEGFPIVLGMSYRGIPFRKDFGYISQDALNFIAVFQAKKFSFGYSYDLTISQLAPYSGGSHEITLEFLWANSRYNPRNIICPTFMKTSKRRR